MKKRRHLCIILLSVGVLVGCSKAPNEMTNLRLEKAHMDFMMMESYPKLPERPLELEDLIAFSLNRNLDLLALEQEYLIQKEVSTGEKLSMLPSLNLNGEWSHRDNEAGSNAKSLVTGLTSTGSSTSSPRGTNRRDFSALWGLLDFGVSYYRSRQEENRAVIVKQRYDRLRQNLILDVIQAYWKAVIAQKAVEGAQSIVFLAKERQDLLQKRIEKQTISEIEGLENEERLIEMQIRLQTFQSDLYNAKTELASLLGIAPGSDFSLADISMHPLSKIAMNVEELENTALLSRPELFIQDLEEKVDADEVRATILSYLPGPTLFANYNYDRNKFLVNNAWGTMGIRAAWNLLSIPRYANYGGIAKAKERKGQRERLSISIGILTQVRLAFLLHQNSIAQHKLSKDLYSVKSRLLEAIRKGEKLGEYAGKEVLRLEAETLFSKINSLTSYAEMQISLERINNSIGKPLHYSYLDMEKIEASKLGAIGDEEEVIEEKAPLAKAPSEEISKVAQAAKQREEEEEEIIEEMLEEEFTGIPSATDTKEEKAAKAAEADIPIEADEVIQGTWLEGNTADEELENVTKEEFTESADEELSEEDIQKIKKSREKKQQQQDQPRRQKKGIQLIRDDTKSLLDEKVEKITQVLFEGMDTQSSTADESVEARSLHGLNISLPIPDSLIKRPRYKDRTQKLSEEQIFSLIGEDDADEWLTDEIVADILNGNTHHKKLTTEEIIAQLGEDNADEELTQEIIQNIFEKSIYQSQVAEIDEQMDIEEERIQSIEKQIHEEEMAREEEKSQLLEKLGMEEHATREEISLTLTPLLPREEIIFTEQGPYEETAEFSIETDSTDFEVTLDHGEHSTLSIHPSLYQEDPEKRFAEVVALGFENLIKEIFRFPVQKDGNAKKQHKWTLAELLDQNFIQEDFADESLTIEPSQTTTPDAEEGFEGTLREDFIHNISEELLGRLFKEPQQLKESKDHIAERLGLIEDFADETLEELVGERTAKIAEEEFEASIEGDILKQITENVMKELFDEPEIIDDSEIAKLGSVKFEDGTRQKINTELTETVLKRLFVDPNPEESIEDLADSLKLSEDFADETIENFQEAAAIDPSIERFEQSLAENQMAKSDYTYEIKTEKDEKVAHPSVDRFEESIREDHTNELTEHVLDRLFIDPHPEESRSEIAEKLGLIEDFADESFHDIAVKENATANEKTFEASIHPESINSLTADTLENLFSEPEKIDETEIAKQSSEKFEGGLREDFLLELTEPVLKRLFIDPNPEESTEDLASRLGLEEDFTDESIDHIFHKETSSKGEEVFEVNVDSTSTEELSLKIRESLFTEPEKIDETEIAKLSSEKFESGLRQDILLELTEPVLKRLFIDPNPEESTEDLAARLGLEEDFTDESIDQVFHKETSYKGEEVFEVNVDSAQTEELSLEIRESLFTEPGKTDFLETVQSNSIKFEENVPQEYSKELTETVIDRLFTDPSPEESLEELKEKLGLQEDYTDEKIDSTETVVTIEDIIANTMVDMTTQFGLSEDFADEHYNDLRPKYISNNAEDGFETSLRQDYEREALNFSYEIPEYEETVITTPSVNTAESNFEISIREDYEFDITTALPEIPVEESIEEIKHSTENPETEEIVKVIPTFDIEKIREIATEDFADESIETIIKSLVASGEETQFETRAGDDYAIKITAHALTQVSEEIAITIETASVSLSHITNLIHEDFADESIEIIIRSLTANNAEEHFETSMGYSEISLEVPLDKATNVKENITDTLLFNESEKYFESFLQEKSPSQVEEITIMPRRRILSDFAEQRFEEITPLVQEIQVEQDSTVIAIPIEHYLFEDSADESIENIIKSLIAKGAEHRFEASLAEEEEEDMSVDEEIQTIKFTTAKEIVLSIQEQIEQIPQEDFADESIESVLRSLTASNEESHFESRVQHEYKDKLAKEILSRMQKKEKKEKSKKQTSSNRNGDVNGKR